MKRTSLQQYLVFSVASLFSLCFDTLSFGQVFAHLDQPILMNDNLVCFMHLSKIPPANNRLQLQISYRNTKTNWIQLVPFEDTGNVMEQVKILYSYPFKGEVNFPKIVQLTDKLPVGLYDISVKTLNLQANTVDSVYEIWLVDSNIAAKSPLINSISKGVVESIKAKTSMHNYITKLAKSKDLVVQKKMLSFVESEINIALRKLDTKLSYQKKLDQYYFYFDTLFIGKCEISVSSLTKAIVQKQGEKYISIINDKAENEIVEVNSVFADSYKKFLEKLNSNSTDNVVTLRTFAGNQQFDYNTNNPFFAELDFTSSTKLAGLPLQIQGFITTQDLGRKTRSSTVKVNLDFDQIKQMLSESTSDLKSLVADRKNKLLQLSDNFEKSSEALATKDLKTKAALRKLLNLPLETNIDSIYMLLKDSALQKVDSLVVVVYDSIKLINKSEPSTVDSLQEIVLNNVGYLELQKQKRQAQINELIAKYQLVKASVDSLVRQSDTIRTRLTEYKGFLANLQNSNYFDSILINSAQNKTNSMRASIINAASNKAAIQKERLLTGLDKFENLQLGILNPMHGKYSLDGQNLTGINATVSMAKIEASLCAGQSSAIERSNYLSRYNCLLAKSMYVNRAGGKIGLSYYSYSIAQTQIDSSLFTNFRNLQKLKVPALRNTIYSMHFADLRFFKNFTWQGELAFCNGQKPEKISNNTVVSNLAVNGLLAYDINKLNLELQIAFEFVGPYFNNATLLFLRRNYAMFSPSIKGNFYRHSIHYHLTANALNQGLLDTNARKSLKAGIDLHTSFKKLPNISLSYKPYSTFQNLEDTFATRQRLNFGSVTAGKISFQFKNKVFTHRGNVNYTRAISQLDSTSSSSSNISAGYTFAAAKHTGSLNYSLVQNTATSITGIIGPINNVTISYATQAVNNHSFSFAYSLATELKGNSSRQLCQLGCIRTFPKLNLMAGLSSRVGFIDNTTGQRRYLMGAATTLTWKMKRDKF
jgi:hypothetical protein